MGFFYSPAHPRGVGKAEGWGAGWKTGGEIHPLALDPPPLGKSHAVRDLKKLFYLSAKISLYNLKGLRLEAAFTCSILPRLKNPAAIRRTAGLGGKNNPTRSILQP